MIDRIKDSLKNDKGFMGSNGFKIIELTTEKAILEYEIKKSGLNPANIAHGGILFGLADTACGVLASTSGKFPLTTNASINYLRPAKSGKIRAIASIIKTGKNIGYYEVKIYDSKDALLCSANINVFYSDLMQ